MIDPSLVEKLGIQGESSQPLLSTVNEREKRQQGGWTSRIRQLMTRTSERLLCVTLGL